jgi:glycerol-3-phosphate dehydrogenase
MAEKLVDQLVQDLGGTPAAASCTTATHRLIGTPDEDWAAFRPREQGALAEQFQLAPELAVQLVERYGSRARTLAAEFGRDVSAWSPIVPGEAYVRAELPYQAAYELAQCPADHFLRRTRLGLFHPELLGHKTESPIAADQRLPC